MTGRCAGQHQRGGYRERNGSRRAEQPVTYPHSSLTYQTGRCAWCVLQPGDGGGVVVGGGVVGGGDPEDVAVPDGDGDPEDGRVPDGDGDVLPWPGGGL